MERARHWRLPAVGTPSCNACTSSFFLGYWFNYNDGFTANGSHTAMSYLTVLDCSNFPFPSPGKGTANHRGYREFVEPVAGGWAGFPGKPGAPARIPDLIAWHRPATSTTSGSASSSSGAPAGRRTTVDWPASAIPRGRNVYSLSNFYDDYPTDQEKRVKRAEDRGQVPTAQGAQQEIRRLVRFGRSKRAKDRRGPMSKRG